MLGLVATLVAACGSGAPAPNEFAFTPRALTAPLEPQQFQSPDPQDGGEFGFATTFAGSLAVFGAPGENGSAGVVYFFDSETGELGRTLTPPDPTATGRFGAALSANAVVTIVGSPSAPTAGVPGGAAYVYGAGESTPSLVFGSDAPDAKGQFGFAVAAAEINFIVGAPGEAGGAGRAYYFDCVTDEILQVFESPNAEPGGRFGAAVATIDFDVFVGAPDENGGEGRVYHFNGLTGELIQTYTSPSPLFAGAFGGSIVVVGNRLLIGAPGEAESLEGFIDSGRAHVVDIATAEVQFSLDSPQSQNGGLFGARVTSNGNQLVVGAPNELGAGIVHVYENDGKFVTSLMSTSATFDGRFGLSLAAAPEDLLVGAPGDEGGLGNVEAAAGAAYLNPPTFLEPQ